MRRILSLIVCLFILLVFPPVAQAGTTRQFAPTATQRFDLVVYGGTPAGVIASVAAARAGARVALLVPGRNLGGMVSGGLGRTDHGRKETIGGFSLEFFRRVGKHYNQPITWYFEPHVAEEVFQEMVREAGIKIFYQHRLKEKGGVKKARGRIEEITTEEGVGFAAKVFVDASYEGDLMAQAGVFYTWGREGVKDWNESLAGVRPRDRHHQFQVRVSAYDAEGRLLPEISPGPRGELGAPDRKVQAYNFRLCLSDDPSNQVPFPQPAGYDAKRYAVLSRLIAALVARDGRPPRLEELTSPLPLPNLKVDVNNNGAFSTDYIGKSWSYANASYAERARIWQDHADYIMGFFYFLAHDPEVPKVLQDEVNRWGLAKDEFQATDHWPPQLYIRECRRMVGDFVMTQKDIQTDLEKPDSIGMGSYNSDSHNVQRYATSEGAIENEGNMEVPVSPYEIPYRVMLPKPTECTNLLVPVCVSASHVAYSTLRMEPVYMIMGHAAGLAAKMAAAENKAVQEISAETLRSKLKSEGAVLEWKER